MDDECGAVGGMLGKGNRILGQNLPQWHSVYLTSHMILPGLEPGLVFHRISYLVIKLWVKV
jgi:hypothetical protein